MQLREMIDKYPQQYIAVAYTKKGIDSLIETATVLKVYPTLLDAYDNLSEIKAYKKRYSDFDIVYGDYEDYAVYKWQNGEALPTLDNLVVLSKVFGVPMDEIVVVA